MNDLAEIFDYKCGILVETSAAESWIATSPRHPRHRAKHRQSPPSLGKDVPAILVIGFIRLAPGSTI